MLIMLSLLTRAFRLLPNLLTRLPLVHILQPGRHPACQQVLVLMLTQVRLPERLVALPQIRVRIMPLISWPRMDTEKLQVR